MIALGAVTSLTPPIAGLASTALEAGISTITLGGGVSWPFTTEIARVKLIRLYPSIDG